jgi:hypothetical protein
MMNSNSKDVNDLALSKDEGLKKHNPSIFKSFKQAFTNKHLKEQFMNRDTALRDRLRIEKSSILSKVEVRKEVVKIEGLQFDSKKQVQDEMITMKQGGSTNYDFLFKKNNTRQMREEGQDLICQIFGNKELINNFDMSNTIKYNQYCRIYGQIEKKNDKV